jgi:putative protease
MTTTRDVGCDTGRAARREETDMAEHLVGTVSHYWDRLAVAGIELSAELGVGDTIHILGHSSDFTQTVDSIQIEQETVESAKAGDSIGVKVSERARINDQVLKVTPD